MFLIEKGTTLTATMISDYINKFETREKYNLIKSYNYYSGRQDIMNKTTIDKFKPCNRIVTNYCYNIVQNYLGYITGKDVKYSSQVDIEDIQNVLNYNDVKTTDSELLRNALIYGIAYELCYIDEDIKERFKVIDSRECFAIYDNTLNQELVAVIRYYPVDCYDVTKGSIVEVYDSIETTIYKCNSSFSGLEMSDRFPNYFNQVPVSVFTLNPEVESVFNKIVTLQDAYNNLLSSEVDDFQAFCDAYLVLKGARPDDDSLSKMTENRVLLIDPDADASYLSKSINDTQIENLLKNINDTIHKIANSPDFNDDKFMAQSGVAMRFKLVGFENCSASIVANMTKSLQKRIELLCSVFTLTNGEEMWRDIEITFTRNLPVDMNETATMVNSLRGVVSNKALLSQISFITDVNQEMENMKEQNAANMEMYNFATPAAAEVDNAK